MGPEMSEQRCVPVPGTPEWRDLETVEAALEEARVMFSRARLSRQGKAKSRMHRTCRGFGRVPRGASLRPMSSITFNWRLFIMRLAAG